MWQSTSEFQIGNRFSRCETSGAQSAVAELLERGRSCCFLGSLARSTSSRVIEKRYIDNPVFVDSNVLFLLAS